MNRHASGASACWRTSGQHRGCVALQPAAHGTRVVLRRNCAKVIANIGDLAISIWAPKVIDELSQIDDI